MKLVLGSYDEVPHPYHHQFLGDLSTWKITDIYPRFSNIIQIDATNIPYKGIEALYASHVLEHIAKPEETIKHWFDVLKVGGWVQINVPDVEWALDQIMRSNNNLPIESRSFNSREALYKIINGTEDSEFDTHKSWFTKDKLYKMLVDAGFTEIEIRTEIEAHDMMCVIAKAYK